MQAAHRALSPSPSRNQAGMARERRPLCPSRTLTQGCSDQKITRLKKSKTSSLVKLLKLLKEKISGDSCRQDY